MLFYLRHKIIGLLEQFTNQQNRWSCPITDDVILSCTGTSDQWSGWVLNLLKRTKTNIKRLAKSFSTPPAYHLFQQDISVFGKFNIPGARYQPTINKFNIQKSYSNRATVFHFLHLKSAFWSQIASHYFLQPSGCADVHFQGCSGTSQLGLGIDRHNRGHFHTRSTHGCWLIQMP